MLVLDDLYPVVRGTAVAAEGEWEEALFRFAWFRGLLGEFEVANSFRLQRGPNRVSSSEELVQPKGEYRKPT
jgi:hypothetical protein